MKSVKIDENFNNVINVDPIAQVEKILGKHHSEFDNNESLLMLSMGVQSNRIKSDYLKSLGDTHFRISWNNFIDLIESYGFVKGLSYDFEHSNGKYEDEAALYFHPEKGLVIWATSYWNKESLNSGKLYGQVKAREKVEFKLEKTKFGEHESLVYTDSLRKAYNSLNNCSHSAFMDIQKGIAFSYDVREALINKIEQIGEHLDFATEWTSSQFLWFLDYNEEKIPNYDYKAITKDKIRKSSEGLQRIVKVYMEE